MAVPVKVTCPANTWTKVATAVTEGNVWITKPNAVYMHTYVATGDPAPTDQSTAVLMPEPGLPVSVDVSADVYVLAKGQNGEVLVAI